jgi:hypothetical protein
MRMNDWRRLPLMLPPWLRQGLIGLGLFLLGGLISFGYSYRPLHGSLVWQVEQLEERLDARNLENMRLADELAKLRSVESERVDPGTFAEIERELTRARTALAQAEKDLSRSERKRKDANASADRWKKRYETLRDDLEVAAKRAPAPAQSTTATRSATAPAAPAPPSTSPAPPATIPPATGPSTPPAGVGTLPAPEPGADPS